MNTLVFILHRGGISAVSLNLPKSSAALAICYSSASLRFPQLCLCVERVYGEMHQATPRLRGPCAGHIRHLQGELFIINE